MHAINGDGSGFERLYADVFGRPRLAVVASPLRVLQGGAPAGAATRTRRHGCGHERRHLRVVDGGRR